MTLYNSLDIGKIIADAKAMLEKAETIQALESIRVQILGRKSKIAELLRGLRLLSEAERRTQGPALQTAQAEIENIYDQQKNILLEKQALGWTANSLDVTAYRALSTRGGLHPLTQLIERIEDIFMGLGWNIAVGPEIEDDFHNFTALNIPTHHPARDEHDTFWLDQSPYLLRTHTSSVEIRILEHTQPPIAICAPGRTYRHEATDATHDFVFTQCEGLFVDHTVSLTHLVGILTLFMQQLFEKSDLTIRLRPGYFPFVEPGLEFDVSCPFCKKGCSVCKHTRWIELGGAGLTHPHVLRSCGVDPSLWSGFAFGCGIERLGMLMYQLNDVRLFKTGKLGVLQQFTL
jgi:phenylalanyl-tRNA synthetase alpha chain